MRSIAMGSLLLLPRASGAKDWGWMAVSPRPGITSSVREMIAVNYNLFDFLDLPYRGHMSFLDLCHSGNFHFFGFYGDLIDLAIDHIHLFIDCGQFAPIRPRR